MKKKSIIIIAAILLVLIIITIIAVATNFNKNAPIEPNPTSETKSELLPTSELPPISAESIVSYLPEMFTIDNTPADVYVDIAAGNSTPGLHEWYEEISIANDERRSAFWIEVLRINPENLQIGEKTPDEWRDYLPWRRIQNMDAARVVGNELLEMRHANLELLRIQHDPNKNIWFFSYGDPIPSMGTSYAVNGYNGQVIRSWVE